MTAGKLLDGLKNNGFRLTNIRTKLVHLFAETRMPLSVEELIRALEKQGITANKTTIYRELAFLMEQNIVTNVDFGDRKKRYESALGGHHHHLMCLRCSRVLDVTLSSDLKKDEQRIAKKNKFKIVSHSLEFFGLCNQCSS